jgi:thiamine pyrophosphate-dependent acetolactate synthase large subunit-like protein
MTVDRATALRALTPRLTDELVVAELGNPTYDLFNAGDRPEHLYLWGGMGLGPSIALGVALATPGARVIGLTGDGGALMNLGAFATIGALQPDNLVVVVWDNRAFDLTGGQPTATAAAADLVAVAAGCGIERSERVSTLEEFEAATARALAEPGPWCLVVDTGPTPSDRRKPLVAMRRRFMQNDAFTDAAIRLREPANNAG